MKLLNLMTMMHWFLILETTGVWASLEAGFDPLTVFPVADGQSDSYQSTGWANIERPSNTDASATTPATVTVTTTTTTVDCGIVATIGPVITAAPNITEVTIPELNNTQTLPAVDTLSVWHNLRLRNHVNKHKRDKREDLNIKPKGSALNWKALLIVVSVSAILLWLGTIYYFYWRIGKLNAAHEAEKAAPPPMPAIRHPYWVG